MDSTPFAEILGWIADALAVIAVFAALVVLIIESGDHDKASEPKAAPILAVVGVIVFLAGNILRYVFAAL